MGAGGIAFVGAGARAGELILAGAGVLGNVKAGLVVDPVDQAIFEDWIGAHDSVRDVHDVTDLARGLRDRDVDCAKTVAVPGVEDQVLEYGGIVILLCDLLAAFAAGFGDGLIQTFVELIVGNGKGTDHDGNNLALDRHHARVVERTAAVDRKSTRLNSSHIPLSRMPSSA